MTIDNVMNTKIFHSLIPIISLLNKLLIGRIVHCFHPPENTMPFIIKLYLSYKNISSNFVSSITIIKYYLLVTITFNCSKIHCYILVRILMGCV